MKPLVGQIITQLILKFNLVGYFILFFFGLRWSGEDCARLRGGNEEHGEDEGLRTAGNVQTIRQAVRGSTKK